MSHCSITVHDDRLVVMNGVPSARQRTQTFMFDDSWHEIQGSTQRRIEGQLVTLNDRVCAIGGTTIQGDMITTQEAWNDTERFAVEPMLHPRYEFAHVVLNGRMVVFGGVGQDGLLRSVESFDGVSSWVKHPEMKLPFALRDSFAIVY